MALQDRQRAAAQESLGMPPALSSVQAMDPTADPGSAVQLNGRRSSAAHGRYGQNLPAIAEVLARYGLDPAEEIARVLTERKPVLDAGGKPVVDEKGQVVTAPILAPAEHAKLAAELLQYTRPKLKATEVTIKPPELTDEQIELRLRGLMQREGDR